MISFVQTRFYRMEAKERKQLLFIMVFAIVGSYGLMASILWEEMFQAQKMANRKANRIDTRLGSFKTPEMKNIVTQKNLDKQRQDLQTLETKLISYSAKLLPLDVPKPQEKVKLELSRMAAEQGITITSLTTVNAQIRPMPQTLDGKQLRAFLDNRPIFQISGQGSYHAFVNFTEQFSNLPYYSIVRNLSMAPLTLEDDTAVNNGLLAITFDLKM